METLSGYSTCVNGGPINADAIQACLEGRGAFSAEHFGLGVNRACGSWMLDRGDDDKIRDVWLCPSEVQSPPDFVGPRQPCPCEDSFDDMAWLVLVLLNEAAALAQLDEEEAELMLTARQTCEIRRRVLQQYAATENSQERLDILRGGLADMHHTFYEGSVPDHLVEWCARISFMYRVLEDRPERRPSWDDPTEEDFKMKDMWESSRGNNGTELRETCSNDWLTRNNALRKHPGNQRPPARLYSSSRCSQQVSKQMTILGPSNDNVPNTCAPRSALP